MFPEHTKQIPMKKRVSILGPVSYPIDRADGAFQSLLIYDPTDSHGILFKIQISIPLISKANSLLSYKADETSSDVISNT